MCLDTTLRNVTQFLDILANLSPWLEYVELGPIQRWVNPRAANPRLVVHFGVSSNFFYNEITFMNIFLFKQ